MSPTAALAGSKWASYQQRLVKASVPAAGGMSAEEAALPAGCGSGAPRGDSIARPGRCPAQRPRLRLSCPGPSLRQTLLCPRGSPEGAIAGHSLPGHCCLFLKCPPPGCLLSPHPPGQPLSPGPHSAASAALATPGGRGGGALRSPPRTALLVQTLALPLWLGGRLPGWVWVSPQGSDSTGTSLPATPTWWATRRSGCRPPDKAASVRAVTVRAPAQCPLRTGGGS